jgi:ribonuclease HI
MVSKLSREAVLEALHELEPLSATLERFPGASKTDLLEALGWTPPPPSRARSKSGPAADVLILHTDGACRGNPGPSSIGVLISDQDGAVIDELAERIGVRTNNYAEYAAVIRGLERALELGAKRVHVKADSQLVVRQLEGTYRVKNEGIKPLFEMAKYLERKFEKGVTYEHVRREQNAEADALANLALDRR